MRLTPITLSRLRISKYWERGRPARISLSLPRVLEPQKCGRDARAPSILVARLGWDGPLYRSDHPFMLKEGRAPLKIPNPHGQDISVDLLIRILRQAGISRKEWLRAR